MARIVVGVISGFLGWMIVWVGTERILSAVFPEGFGAHQLAFTNAIINGGPFEANQTLLFIHIVLASLVSMISGFLAALVAGENSRAPLVLGLLLVAMGFLKAGMSWPYVPLWYHFTFTAVLFPTTVMGGKWKTAT